MEARIRNELERYLERLNAVHAEIFGGAFTSASVDARTKLRDVFLSVVEDVIAMAKKGKEVHERFLQRLVIDSIDAIVALDGDGRIFFWNRGAEITFGYSKDEMIGKHFSIIVPEHLIADGELERLNQRTLQKGFIRDYITERVTKSGKKIDVSLSRTLIRDETENLLGFVAVIRDISETLDMQRHMQQTERLALVGQLTAGIAHEVGTPLNIISGTAQYLMLNRAPDDPEREELDTIVRQIERIDKLIQQLLSYARPTVVQLSAVALDTLIAEVCVFLRKTFEQNRITLLQNVDPSLPTILADRNQLFQVFINLLMNANDAFQCDTNGRAREVQIAAYCEASDSSLITLEVADTGCGISPETLPNIFNPFFTTKQVGTGTGLGLAVTRRIVEDHAGTITVASRVGMGTTFTIQLPVLRGVVA